MPARKKAEAQQAFEPMESWQVNADAFIAINRDGIAIAVAGGTALLTVDDLAALESAAKNARERFAVLQELPEFAKQAKSKKGKR